MSITILLIIIYCIGFFITGILLAILDCSIEHGLMAVIWPGLLLIIILVGIMLFPYIIGKLVMKVLENFRG